MPACVNCGASLTCTSCNTEQPVGQTMIDCPKLAKGRLWIHVTDDRGVNVPGVPVSGTSDRPTDPTGMAKFEDLTPNSYNAAMMPRPEHLKDYDIAKETGDKKTIFVKAGVLAYVQFRLVRKAKLKVNFWVLSGKNLATKSLLDAKGVTVDSAYTGDGVPPNPASRESAKGHADFGVVSAGKYKLRPVLGALSPDEYEYVDTPLDVELQPDDDKAFDFTVQRKARLKVEIVYKRDTTYHLRDKEDGKVPITLKFLGNAIKPGTEHKATTTEGIAEFPSLSPGKYEVTPDFNVLEKCKFDWTAETREVEIFPDVDEPVIFEVEPLYQQVKFIAHCLLTIPTQKYELSDEDKQLRIDESKLPAYVFKKRYVIKNKYSRAEVVLDATKATLEEKLTLEMKKNSLGTYHTPDELNKAEMDKLSSLTLFCAQPPIYVVTKKQALRYPVFDKDDQKKAEYRGRVLLVMKEHQSVPNTYYQPADLPPEQLTKFTVVKKLLDTPLTFEVQLAGKPVEEGAYELKDLTGKWRGKYHGDPDDTKDIKDRVDFITDTINKAHDNLDADSKHPTVLKVFMVPECFFQGLHGAYLEKDKDTLIAQLHAAVQAEKWKDWVFGFGTVNSLREAPKVPDIAFAGTIYEMRNQAPLIRGGVSAAGKPSTRLVPKLLNSAELADHLIEDANKTRTQATNENVQFMAADIELDAGNLLQELLNEEKATGGPGKLFETNGLPAKWWKDPSASGAFNGPLEELKTYLARWGMARVVREILYANNDNAEQRVDDLAKPIAVPLDEWAYCSYSSAIREADTAIPTRVDALALLIQTTWKKLYPAVPFESKHWNDSAKRTAVLSEISTNCHGVSDSCGFRLTHQKLALKAGIDELLNDDDAAVKFGDSLKRARVFVPSIFPLWKKLLEMYIKHKASPVKLALRKKDLNLDDYCVVGPRKAAPWLDTIKDGKALEPCKRMVFGLEICADHADKRLIMLNVKDEKQPDVVEIGIDIQLVPSAGMSLKQFATRDNGYLFNCDGWNQPPNGGKTVEVKFEGPPLLNPVYPHSAVAKCPKALDTVGPCLTPTVPDIPSKDLAKGIFEFGPGELHFYPLQDLPK